jgi:hypothetical protein
LAQELLGSPNGMPKAIQVVSPNSLERSIHEVRGQRVILDFDLAALYGVSTKRLNEQVRRNRPRFPADFAFMLTSQEVAHLKSQNATSSLDHGGRRSLPLAFTEHGAIMAANVLNSAVAVRASVQVVRAFVRLREMLVAHRDLGRKLAELEAKYDVQFQDVFAAIRQLMLPSDPRKKKVGFRTTDG